MNYSPSTLYLKSLEERLKDLNIPIYFRLPPEEVLEPFLVIGNNSTSTELTAQNGLMVERMDVQIDIFVDGSSRVEAEEMKSRAVRLLGRNNYITTQILADDTVGREVFHIVLTVSDIVL